MSPPAAVVVGLGPQQEPMDSLPASAATRTGSIRVVSGTSLVENPVRAHHVGLEVIPAPQVATCRAPHVVRVATSGVVEELADKEPEKVAMAKGAERALTAKPRQEQVGTGVDVPSRQVGARSSVPLPAKDNDREATAAHLVGQEPLDVARDCGDEVLPTDTTTLRRGALPCRPVDLGMTTTTGTKTTPRTCGSSQEAGDRRAYAYAVGSIGPRSFRRSS